MAGDYLQDTNVLISFLKGESTVVKCVDSALSVRIPFIVLGELYYGARNSSRVEENLARVEELASCFEILLPDLETLQLYGDIRAELKIVGNPIPEADLWIASLSIQHDLVLVSRDDHFSAVRRIQLERW